MNTKRWALAGIMAIVLVLIGGIFLWQKSHRTSANTNLPQNNVQNESPKKEEEIPQAATYAVPILMYHYIRDASGESELGQNLSVSPQNFDLQVLWLKNNNYQTLTVADLADTNRKVLSKIIYEKKKPIILTFDDGYADAYTDALPILQKYQMTATFYIIRDYVGRPEYMSQDQIDELQKDGFEIGSHTLSHPDLTKLNIDEAKKQIFDSKEKATTFCYPAGKYNTTAVNLVQEAGYSAAVTTHFGIADQNSSILELPRVRVENVSGETLGQKIEAALEQL